MRLEGNAAEYRIGFRPMRNEDLAMFAAWLRQPHVAQWWQPTPSESEVVAEYSPLLAAGDESILDSSHGFIPYIAFESQQPIGYIQSYRVMAHQADGWWLEETDPCAVGIDQFLADANRLWRGLGSAMVREFTSLIWQDPRVTTIQTDPDPENARAIRAYQKAGFVEVETVITLDGPARLMKKWR